MSKRYLKGKDGKFEGSLPDPDEVPRSIDEMLPRKAEEPVSWLPLSGITPREKVDELDELYSKVQEAKRYRRLFPLFSEERKRADDRADELADELKELRKALEDRCWRCYGTGKPINGQGDTLEVYRSCPECNRIPSR